MKRYMNLLFGCFILFALTACNREKTYPEVSNAFQNGSWRVAEFIHVGNDETYMYVNYKVTFTTLETVTASGMNFYRGNWKITSDGDLWMDWGKTYSFDRFNATWNIVNYNDQVITLDLVDGTDHLVFEKIQ